MTVKEELPSLPQPAEVPSPKTSPAEEPPGAAGQASLAVAAEDRSIPSQEPLSMAILLGGMALFLLIGWIGRSLGTGSWSLDRPADHQFDYRIDLNTATPFELRHLPGVGPKLADRIVEERERGGNFRDLDDLDLRVRGVGPTLCEKIAPYIEWPSPTPKETAPLGQ